jgi:hypothetical protein
LDAEALPSALSGQARKLSRQMSQRLQAAVLTMPVPPGPGGSAPRASSYAMAPAGSAAAFAASRIPALPLDVLQRRIPDMGGAGAGASAEAAAQARMASMMAAYGRGLSLGAASDSAGGAGGVRGAGVGVSSHWGAQGGLPYGIAQPQSLTSNERAGRAVAAGFVVPAAGGSGSYMIANPLTQRRQ